ncbi:Mevalonyl-coenzyme A hydratase sidH [Pseudolycoriella hygida]|uniref:Mevalonyl-coenzyme A hydratase sidH n=1 Tax=Pseudolycoriella hygida TaxID=35572 RepID=A0A9Q0NHV3_9DIPT|nr:Mevalonyl-coenzyme A hydratase sidH [Pseudolycoriella hygida]
MPSRTETTMKPLVIVEKLECITLIGINRPEKRNCVNHATAQKLMEAINEFEDDKNAKVAIIYGKGGTFCAGYDLKETSESANNETLAISDNFNPFNSKGAGPLGPTRRFFSKPVIAAVSGYAVAGGFELALACDLRVVEESSVFGVFCRRFGVPLIDGGTVRLPALIGLSRALDIILTGRPVKAKEALQLGLANRVVKNGKSLSEAILLAKEIAKHPQECMLRDRASAWNSTYSSSNFQEAIEYEMSNSLDVIMKESIAGASSFVNGAGRHGSFNTAPNSKL